jgi:hypothetical protein
MAQLLSELQPHGAELPHMVFFKPTVEFIQYVKGLNPTLVVDIGAGVGQMSKELTDVGIRCLPIDICERPGEVAEIYRLDALTLDYPENSLPIMARPCHGLWVEYAIQQALTTTPKMLYVGLPKNIRGDLTGIEGIKKTRLDFIAGRDGEIVIEIRRK